MYRRLLLLTAIAVLVWLSFGATTSPAAAADDGRISGRVTWDLDRDGDPSDKNEPGLSGWTLVLESEGSNNPRREETKTDANGLYVFEDLPYGDYSLSMPCNGQPDAWGYSFAEIAGYVVNLSQNLQQDDFNFPVIPLASAPVRTGKIVGKVVLDENRDGRVSTSDRGMGGWHITVQRADPVGACADESLQTAVDAEGDFSFDHLNAGPYSVYPDSDGAPLARWAVDSPLTGSQGAGKVSSQMPSADVRDDAVASVVIGILSLEGSAAISGSVYADANRNGARDTGEPVAITGCWIMLMYDFDSSRIRVNPYLSNCEPDGVYRFTDLAPGEYTVAALYQFSSAVNPPADENGITYSTLHLNEGEQRVGVDFGYGAVPGSAEVTPPSPVIVSAIPSALPPSGNSVEGNANRLFAFAVLSLIAGIMVSAFSVRQSRRR
jgi:hypothetical protein